MPECAGCRAKIEFIEGANGKKIPVQKVTAVYELVAGKLVKAELRSTVRDASRTNGLREVWISHFQTCPDAGKF